MVVAAHPDDEVIGIGSLLPKLAGCAIVQITDGSPRDTSDALRSGLATRERYAQARRTELFDALALAAISPDQCGSLNVTDQEASFHLTEIARRLAERMESFKPDIVIAHPYEGGHPDHDAAAFATRAAVRLLRVSGDVPLLVEMSSYHMGPNGITPFSFLPAPPNGDLPVCEHCLTADERDLKSRMLACFTTQSETLQYFPVERELLRIAPEYDFTQPPHPGRLFYEHFDWNMTGDRFRSLAAEALTELGLQRSAATC